MIGLAEMAGWFFLVFADHGLKLSFHILKGHNVVLLLNKSGW